MTDGPLKTGKKEILQQQGEPTKTQKTFLPAVDIYETANHIAVLAEMPGVDRKDVEIHLKDGVLSIKGNSREETAPGEIFLQREFETGNYARQFSTSESIDQEKIEAVIKNGILTILLPKAKPADPRQIEIKAG